MNKNSKLVSALIVGSMFLSNSLAVYAQTYTPQYGGQSNYATTPGASYGFQSPQDVVNQYVGNPYSNVQSYAQAAQKNYLPPLQGRVLTVPSGAQIDAVASSDISSEFLTIGDSIYVTLPSGYYYAGNMVLPPNSAVQGDVVMAVKSGRTGKNGQLKIKFSSAITPTGQRIPLSGKFATEDGTGILKGGTGMDRAAGVAKNAAVGAGVGALSGLVFGAMAGGKPGKGTALGTALGGGLGLTKAVVDKGADVVIPANSKIDIILDQPLTATPSQGY